MRLFSMRTLPSVKLVVDAIEDVDVFDQCVGEFGSIILCPHLRHEEHEGEYCSGEAAMG